MSDERIEQAMLGARLLRPYYARALAALAIRIVPDLHTVAVDRWWHLYVDPVWLAGLDPLEQATVLAAHEVEHLLRNHDRLIALGRSSPANNIAGDVEINDDTGPAERLFAGAITPALFGWPDHLLAEEYLRLIEDAEHGAGRCCGGGSGAGAPGLSVVNEEEGPGTDGLDEVASARIRIATAGDVRAYVERHGQGSVPLGVRVWADALLTPTRIDWRDSLPPLLGHLIGTQRGRDDYSWRRLARRQRPGAPLRPGTVRLTPVVGLAVDTSGSMASDTLRIVAGAARSAAGVAPGSLIVAQGDAQLTARLTIGLPSAWYGGGGSNICPLIDALTMHGVGLIVCVTDCLTAWPAVAPAVPTVVLALTDASSPPWATRIDVRVDAP